MIDNIFFNSLEYHSNSGNLLLEISDHLIQFVILEGYIKERTLPEINLFKRDLNNFNEREFYEEVILKVNWDEVCDLGINDPQKSFKQFYDTFSYHLDEFAPYRKVTKNEFKLMFKPWITKDILHKCKHRDSILKEMKKENDPLKKDFLQKEYKKSRNEITKLKRDNKKTYYISYFEKNKNKSSEIWKGIKSLVNIKSSKISNIKNT